MVGQSRLGCSDAICQRLVTWHLSLDSHLDGGHDDDDDDVGDNNDDEDDDVGNDDAVGNDYDNVWLPGSCHWTTILMVMVRMFLIAIMTWYLSPDSRPCLPIVLYYNDHNSHIGARMSLLTKKIFQTVCSMSRTLGPFECIITTTTILITTTVTNIIKH